ncbi:MAG: amino acid adenylation domain-containing protein, partial [Micrococcales bacterium]|nr:amino acid adenylation domain-containing protein [Micrococcales bacterium]
SQVLPHDPSADLAFAFSVTDVDWDLLARCLHTAVAASPGLRTRFEVDGAQLVAVVDDHVPSVTVRDVGHADAVQAGVLALAQALDAGPLDTGGTSLFEVCAFVGATSGCLTVRSSHLVGDAVSFATVLGCVGDLYGTPEDDWPRVVEPLAAHPGTTPPVPLLRRGQDAYRELLAEPAVLHHPALSPPHGNRIAGQHYQAVVGGARARRLRQSKAAGLFGVPTTVFTAYAATLQRLAGTSTVTLGVPVANRSRSAAQAVGCYVNTLVLPVTIDRSDTWLTVAARVQAGTRLLMANQGLDLLNDGAGRRVDRTDNAVTFYDKGLGLSLPGAAVEPVAVPRSCVQYPLVVTVEDRGRDGFRVGTAVASHLAEADPAGLFDEALTAVVDDPSGAVVGPSVFAPGWQGPPAGAPARQHTDVVGRIRTRARQNPDARALVTSDGAVLTYRDLVERVDAVASGLDAVGATKAVVVAVPKSIDAVVAILGVAFSGRTYVPVNPDTPPRRLRSVLLQVAEGFGGPPTVVTADGEPLVGSATTALADLVVAGEISDGVTRHYGPHDLAYVIFTSGSTGEPKGVMVERHNIADLLDGTDACFDFAEHEVWCLFHSLAFDFSVWEVFGALAHGHTLVVPTADEVANPETFVELATSQQVTVLNQTPSAFRRLRTTLVRTGQRLPHVRTVVFGGEALYPADIAAWLDAGLGEPVFVNMYGITETTVHTTFHLVTPDDLACAQTSVVGRPLPGWGTLVVDELGCQCPAGIAGELLVTGNGLARGYLGRPDLTADRFRWLDGGTRAYRSGDRVSVVGDELVYHGRVDTQVQLRGFRIEPGDVAAGLEATGEVQAAVVQAVHPQGHEPFLAAWVVPASGTTVAQIRTAAAQVLPDYMLPSRIVVVDDIPTTPNGKPDLDALTLPPAPESTIVAGSTAAQIAAIWEQVIGAGPVGLDDRFLDVGGTSMNVMEVQDMLARQLDAGWLTLVDLFTHPTPQQLADRIESHRQLRKDAS